MTKQLFKGFLFSLGFAAMGSAQIITPPPCSSYTTFFQALEGNDCTLGGGFVLKNANFASSNTGNEILPSQVNFSASYLAGIISIGLSGPFQTALGETHTYSIGFLIDPPPEIIIGFESDVDWGSTTNALSTQAGTGLLNIDLCAGAAYSGRPLTCPAVERNYISNPANPRGGATFPATNIVDVNLLLQLSDGGQLNSIFTRTATIPEPAVGYAAGGIGLVMLLIRRRR